MTSGSCDMAEQKDEEEEVEEVGRVSCPGITVTGAGGRDDRSGTETAD